MGTPVTTSALGQITRYGGPILYLIVYGFILFAILVWVDSGSVLPRRHYDKRRQVAAEGSSANDHPVGQDVAEEAKSVANSNDLLRVLEVTKTFGRNTVVEDISFGVSRDTVFALLGPNGAGKTTTFNVIRELFLSSLS
jgi:ATP-binding cassette subfamily A (ABC1) protein 3